MKLSALHFLGSEKVKIYIINPTLTMENPDKIQPFVTALRDQFDKYDIIHAVITNSVKYMSEICVNDIVLIFNDVNYTLDKATNDLLDKLKQIGTSIYPIALDIDNRIPANIITSKQSFDICEQLRCRGLTYDHMSVIAQGFARKLISEVMPTIYKEDGMIFISHKRIDGETIAANLCDALKIQINHSKLFRDITSVEVGHEAQKEIDESMIKSDAFIFLHTPKSIDSKWIQKELRFALIRGIPVLWIQIDNADYDKLAVKPSDKPHLSYASSDFDDKAKLSVIVDEIMDKLFEIIMLKSNRVFDYYSALQELFKDKIKQADKDKMIYNIDIERKGYCYPQRNIVQYIQLYGRTPTEADKNDITALVEKFDKPYDSAVILTDTIVKREQCSHCIVETYDDFIYNWKIFLYKMNKNINKEIIISGAFPNCDEIYKQTLTDALVIFCKSILRAGYTLTFGSHPTFQELIFALSKQVKTSDDRNHLKMYISKYLENKYQLSYLKKNAQVYETENKGSIESSLTLMRTEMIQRDNVAAMVCLGGMVRDDKKKEGIREEIGLAVNKKIPVFIVGSVGGCSLRVAEEYKSQGWKGLNNAPESLNSAFADSIDYYSLSQMMLKFLNETTSS